MKVFNLKFAILALSMLVDIVNAQPPIKSGVVTGGVSHAMLP
ncbi:hypothetical protein [Abyssogena phaseoliformis symbiont]|nr:hypothetical protein [Abyssogena phaseoliformis symbiont]MBW5288695.1 hypothetical protein [Candidatus Ruthia sp. Apha_13_S6]